MAIDWGNILGMAGTGAGAGASLGPIGAAVGAGAGLLTGLFGSASQPPQFQSYTDPIASAAIQRLLTQQLGQKQASRAAANLRGQATQQMDALKENPNFAGNASILSALNNRLQRQAEEGIVGAQLKGAQIDQDAVAQAAQLQQRENQFGLQRNEFNLQQYQQGLQPSFLESLFGQGVSATLGAGLGKANARTPYGDKNRSTDNVGYNTSDDNSNYG